MAANSVIVIVGFPEGDASPGQNVIGVDSVGDYAAAGEYSMS